MRPIVVAIVGSGPSGFFCADDLLRLARPCQVHMFDRRPYPFGLVRDGVAPDHENIRSVMRAFNRTAQRENFFFHGNVEIGPYPAVTDLLSFFDAVIVATGAECPKKLFIPGAERAGCIAASHFAEWYNGSPFYYNLKPCLDGEGVVVIGGGNVALDMARMLAQPHERLQHTDISSAALRALRDGRVRDIHVVVRGPKTLVRFSPSELEFLLQEIPDCSYTISEFAGLPPRNEEKAELSETARRNCEILQTMATLTSGAGACRKHIHFHFGKRVARICGEEHVEGIILEPTAEDPSSHEEASERTHEYIACRMVLYAIGQQGSALSGLPFDSRKGTIPNSAGRITGLPRAYVAGWIKRGATGAIGINKPDCRETVRNLMADCAEFQGIRGKARETDISAWCAQFRRPLVSYADWKLLDTEERRRGQALGKARERFVTDEEMLAFLRLQGKSCDS